MSASLCHHSLLKVATCYRNIERTIVHFSVVRTKVCTYPLMIRPFQDITCYIYNNCALMRIMCALACKGANKTNILGH